MNRLSTPLITLSTQWTLKLWYWGRQNFHRSRCLSDKIEMLYKMNDVHLIHWDRINLIEYLLSMMDHLLLTHLRGTYIWRRKHMSERGGLFMKGGGGGLPLIWSGKPPIGCGGPPIGGGGPDIICSCDGRGGWFGGHWMVVLDHLLLSPEALLWSTVLQQLSMCTKETSFTDTSRVHNCFLFSASKLYLWMSIGARENFSM